MRRQFPQRGGDLRIEFTVEQATILSMVFMMPELAAFGEEGGSVAAKPFLNARGQLTDGRYTVNDITMAPHKTGSLAGGKSQWFSNVDAERAILDAAARADAEGLWVVNKAKVPASTEVGALGRSSAPTRWISVHRTNTGFVHGFPASAP